MDEEWISRNPRKRDRRSYDSSWGFYEARGGNNGFAGNSSRPRSCPTSISARDIIVEGERVGVPHNGSVQQRPQQGAYGGANRQTSGYEYQHQNQPVTSYQQQQQAAGYQQQNPQQSSRIRVADYRGSAAKVGNLPAQIPTNTYNKNNYGNQNNRFNSGPPAPGSRPSQNNNTLPTALATSLHAVITNPPPITIQLPPELRSTLNKEQCSVVESILSGNSVFFTGPAGSGKSHILKSLLKANELGLGPNGQPRNIVVTATTGVAACSIGGTTIHSFAGITPNASDAECVKRIMGNEYAKKRWRECDVLVVDEISMMGAGFLDKLNFVSGRVRNDR
jgi:hypothetical protein